MINTAEPRGSLLSDRSFQRKALAPVLVLAVTPIMANALAGRSAAGRLSGYISAVPIMTVGVAMAMLIGASAVAAYGPRSVFRAGIAAAGTGAVASGAYWLQSWILIPASFVGTAWQWRMIAGVPLVMALAAVAGAALGLIIRNERAATVALLGWILIDLGVARLPVINDALGSWLPLTNAYWFLAVGGIAESGLAASLGPWRSIAWFVLATVLLLVAALVVVRRRGV